MGDSQSKPSFFECLISRLSGELDFVEDVVSLLRQAYGQEVSDASTFFRLKKVSDFAELKVRDVIITRSQVNVIKKNDDIDRIMAYIIETSHSRSPAINDDKDEVLDILHVEDLLKFTASPGQFNLQNILRPTVFVPEGKSLNSPLKELREQRSHMIIVIDEYDGVSGLVTFEDIIEQAVSDIEGEFDKDESTDNIHAVSAGRRCISAVAEIEGVNAFFGVDYSDKETSAIGGLAIQGLGRLPMHGEKVVVDPLQFTAARADERRLHALMTVRIKEEN